MARTLSTAQFQAMQAEQGEMAALGDAEIGSDNAAELDPITGRIVAKTERASAVVAEHDTVATRLRALDVRRQCDAEMALGEIKGKVREAADAAGVPADYGAVSTEAERIWTSFGQGRAAVVDRGHEFDVAQNGEVRDWRRPDTTPDRGPDVGTTVHTIGDDEGPRFSGAGAADDEEPEPDRFPVPSDASFANKLFRDAPELANIAEVLIGEHGYLDNLRACRIRYLWKRKTGVSKGRLKIGYIARVSGLLAHAYPGIDFVIWLSASTARESRFTPRQVEAAILHQLCHVGEDDNGNWIKVPHDFEGFGAEVTAYGVWTQDLKAASVAFRTAQQFGLFDESEDDEDLDDEGPDLSGEIADTDDITVTAGDSPADPDADYDDERDG